MQYGDFPLFILLSATIYLAAIYAALKRAERQPQKES